MFKLFRVRGNVNGVVIEYVFDNPVKRDDFLDLMYSSAKEKNLHFSHIQWEEELNEKEVIIR